MKKLKIFFDLDDVGNELCRFLVERYNQDYNDSLNWLENTKQMIWENENFKANKDYIFKIMYEKGAFFEPKPTNGFAECVKKLMDDGYDVRILTYPQWESKYCVNEKIEWIKTYLPFFDVNHVIMTKLKGEVAGENKILIDDSPNNLTSWEENGGISISYSVIKYSQDWEGLKVSNFDELYTLIDELNRRS